MDHAPNPSNQACPTSYAPLRAARGEEAEDSGRGSAAAADEDESTERMSSSTPTSDDEEP